MLNDLIFPNIRKSLHVIDQRGLEFSFDRGELPSLPSFKRVNGNIVCAQADYFGFYVLRSALRGLELSTNFLVAGQRTLNDGLHGPAVASLYTAAYHVVESFLALSGRVCIDPGDKKRSQETDAPSVYAGLLTHRNSWAFEKRRRTHAGRWKDLRPVLLKADAESIPYFQDLFQHFFRGQYKSRTPIKSYLKALGSANPLPVGEPLSLRDEWRPSPKARQKSRKQKKLKIVDKFLWMISESRHDALYTGFGSDPLAYEAAVNGEWVNEGHMAAQARAFEKFAREVIDEVSAKLDELLGNLNLSEAVKVALFLSVWWPWFDTPRYDLIQPKELAIRLKRVSRSIQSQNGPG